MMKNHLPKLIPLVIIVILFLAIGSNAYYILGNEEQAVVERFGRLHQVVDSSGLNFKIPLIPMKSTAFSMDTDRRARPRPTAPRPT